MQPWTFVIVSKLICSGIFWTVDILAAKTEDNGFAAANTTNSGSASPLKVLYAGLHLPKYPRKRQCQKQSMYKEMPVFLKKKNDHNQPDCAFLCPVCVSLPRMRKVKEPRSPLSHNLCLCVRLSFDTLRVSTNTAHYLYMPWRTHHLGFGAPWHVWTY